MAEAIDHAAEARRLDDAAWQKGGPLGDALIRTHEQRQDMILSAQVHATLALAEQQRIANDIAYARLLEAQYAEAALHDGEFDWATHQQSIERHGIVLDRIRKGLGL